MAAGLNHLLVALLRRGGAAARPSKPRPSFLGSATWTPRPRRPTPTWLPNTPVKTRLDLRPVLAAFSKQGYWTTFKGDRLYRADFQHVYVAGGAAPLSWDFDNLVNKPELELKDPDGRGIYETTLMLNQPAAAKTTATRWK